ncbi:MAG: spore germination protein, partial [Clostridia bacterium]|nr:spore germination protein [Clostridia bacterium]
MLDYEHFVRAMDTSLCPEQSFDLIKRDLIVAERPAVLYFIDGFIKDEIFEKMLEFLFKQTPDTLAGITSMQQFQLDRMPYVEVDVVNTVSAAVTAVLSGPAVLVIQGIDGALCIDTRSYPVRAVEEPQKDRSLRGSRDGFVETLIFNTALIRRRIRTEKLRMEYVQIGNRTKLDIAISYIDGLADPKALQLLRDRFKKLKLNGISMTQQAVAEALVPSKFLNPFPKFKFTERPDYASACILDGKIAVVLDNSPSVMI